VPSVKLAHPIGTLRRYSSLPPHAQQRIFEAAPPMRNGKPGRKVPLQPGPT
jgi:pre-mRNA-splicing factor ATP-dependent RNA helicase DHX15/PRP43